MSVGQCELLVSELLDKHDCLLQFRRVEASDSNGRFLDETQKRYRSALIVTPKKPAVSLGDYQRGGEERWRIGKQ